MYSALIVDDEKWITEYIRAIIERNNPGIEVIGLYENGVTALDAIEKSKPDIVITDIRMPGIDGLDMIRKVKEKGLESKFIIISGYAEFEYAQRAINYGAVGYCLKPLNAHQLLQLLQKTVEILRSSRSSGLNIIDVMDDISRSSEYNITDFGKLYNVNFSKSGYIMAVTTVGGPLGFPAGTNSLSIKTGISKWFHLIECKHPDSLAKIPAAASNQSVKSIGTGNRVEKSSDIVRAVKETELAAFNFFITGIRKIYDISEVSRSTDIKAIISRLTEAVSNTDMNTVDDIFKSLDEIIGKRALNVHQALNLFNSCIMLCKQENECYDEIYYDYGNLVQSFENAGQMLKYIKSQILLAFEQSSNNQYKDLKNITLKQILKYIDRSFSQQITVQSVSTEFHVGISYICQLFRKELGKTFTEYLNEIRIGNACDLLRNSDLSLDEIGEKVGYNDYFYFNRVFKKITGKPPKKYKTSFYADTMYEKG